MRILARERAVSRAAPNGPEEEYFVADKSLQLIGIGNAIVDVLSRADDGFIEKHDVARGGMTLIDADKAGSLYDAMGPGVEVSGGSVANATAGFAALGGKAGFIGKVKDDQLGQVFAHDLRSAGVAFSTPFAKDGDPTARCLVLVSPDGQRSMATYLGATQNLSEEDIDPDFIASAEIVYLEGYLWDPPKAKKAFRKAMDAAKATGTKVAFTLSDSMCVDRYRDEFRRLIEDDIDILFANEAELKSLYETSDFDEALQSLRPKLEAAAVTRSEKGSVVIRDGEIHVVEAEPIDRVVDATGAGDLYSAGFLYGYANGHSAREMGRIASICAAEIISHYGARPEADLQALVKQRLAA